MLKNKGFTLIEVTVVAVILGILALIVFTAAMGPQNGLMYCPCEVEADTGEEYDDVQSIVSVQGRQVTFIDRLGNQRTVQGYAKSDND